MGRTRARSLSSVHMRIGMVAGVFAGIAVAIAISNPGAQLTGQWPQCGNGVLNPGEQCDDGNQVNTDSCTNTCVINPICGNRRVDGREQCDDGNTTPNDGCSASCNIERCGNRLVEGTEECDDGNFAWSTLCSPLCKRPKCGDGITVSVLGEQCDDGGTANNDGCSATCQIERPASANVSFQMTPLPPQGVERSIPGFITSIIRNNSTTSAATAVVARYTISAGILDMTRTDTNCVQSPSAAVVGQPNVLICTIPTIAAGASYELKIGYNASAAACGSWIWAQGSVQSNGQSGFVYATLRCSATIPTADMQVSQRLKLPATTLTSGTRAVYELAVTNQGPQPVTTPVTVKLTYPMNAGLAFSNPGMYCTPGVQGVVTCTFPSMPAAHSNLFNITSDPITAPQNICGTPVTTTAEATGTFNDPVPTNNRVTISPVMNCPAPSADLSIAFQPPMPTLSASPTSPVWTLNLSNAGPNIVPNAVVNFHYPPNVGLSFSRIDWRNCNPNGLGVMTCNFANVQPGSLQQFIIQADSYAQPAQCASSFPITLDVTGTIQDVSTQNNTVTANQSVVCATPQSTGTLTVAVQSTGTTDTAVKNQTDVRLLSFTARAGDNDDVRLTKAEFVSQEGSLNNAQNYALWVDTDGDNIVETKIQTGVAAQANKVIFNSITGGGYVIPRARTVTFEVRANIAASLTDSSLQIKFGSDSFIAAETATTGVALTGISTNNVCTTAVCRIAFTAMDSVRYTLASQGNLYITKSLTPIRSRQLLGGTLGDTVLNLVFQASLEPIAPISLRFSATGNGAGSIDRLELYRVGEMSAFAYATPGACGAYIAKFCTTNAELFVVPKGGQTEILVRPRMKDDVIGALSGPNVSFGLQNTDSVVAIGKNSGNSLAFNNNDINANGEVFIGLTTPGNHQPIVGVTHAVVLSKIVTVSNANPAAPDTMVPTGISPIGQFKFAAAPNSNSKNALNKVVFTDFIFTFTSDNVAMAPGSFKLYNKSDATIKSPCIILDALPTATTYSVACWNLNATSVQTTVDQSSDITLVLEGEVTNPQVSGSRGSFLQVSLDKFTDPTISGMASNLNHIHWLDKDMGAIGQGTTTSSEFWSIEYPEASVKSTKYTNN